MAKWAFILTDLMGNQLGELTEADNRTVSLPLNRIPTASCVVPATHYLAPYLLNRNWDGLMKCYKDSTLKFVGPVVTTDNKPDQAQGIQSITATAAGPMWRLGFRLLGTGVPGWSLGNASSTQDLGFIAQQILTAANASGFTGISIGTFVASTQGAAGPYWMKPSSDAIAELATGLNSFDFEVAPIEPHDIGLGWPEIGKLNVANVIGGTVQNNVVYEYNAGARNIINYGLTTDRGAMLTHGYINDPSASDHSGILTSTDVSAEASRGRFEALVDDGGTQWTVLRQALVDEHVQVRKHARQVVTIKLKKNVVPTPLVDWSLGDQIRARIIENNVTILDGMMRCWGVTINIDKENNEDYDLTLLDPGASSGT